MLAPGGQTDFFLVLNFTVEEVSLLCYFDSVQWACNRLTLSPTPTQQRGLRVGLSVQV